MKVAVQLPEEPNRGGWKNLEYDLGQAFKHGAKKMGGWDVHVLDFVEEPGDFDIVGFVGVKQNYLRKRCAEAGVPYIYFDKPYNREKGWWKISYGGHQPTKFLGLVGMDDKRRKKTTNWNFTGWRPWTQDGHVLIAGSSLKYHIFHDLEHPTPFWDEVIRKLGKITDRRILYRPKKSWHQAEKIEGSEFSTEFSIYDDLKGAHAMVTYGSNAVMEAIICGVPSICLGDAVAAPFSSRILGDAVEPLEAPAEKVNAVLNDLAHCQWKVGEIHNGDFWSMMDGCIQISKTLPGTSPGVS